LVVNFALGAIPLRNTNFISDIYNFFSNSPQRCVKFDALQKELNVRSYKISRPSATRAWTTLENNIVKILVRWPELEIFFKDEKSDLADQIYKQFSNPDTYCYLKFLELSLHEINALNLHLQENTSHTTTLMARICEKFNFFIKMILKKAYHGLEIPDKIQMLGRVKELDLLTISDEYAKNAMEFETFIGLFYGNDFNLNTLDNQLKQEL